MLVCACMCVCLCVRARVCKRIATWILETPLEAGDYIQARAARVDKCHKYGGRFKRMPRVHFTDKTHARDGCWHKRARLSAPVAAGDSAATRLGCWDLTVSDDFFDKWRYCMVLDDCRVENRIAVPCWTCSAVAAQIEAVPCLRKGPGAEVHGGAHGG